MFRNNLFIAILIIIVSVSISAYIVFYESSNDCFVKEMKIWGEKEELTNRIQSLTQDGSKMAVAKAKTILKESNLDDYNGGLAKVYIQIGTVFEYCNIKY